MTGGHRFVIAGGGIGGLATARALRLRGFNVRVLESSASLGNEGAGLAIQPNGMLALRCLGLDTAVTERGIVIQRAAILDRTNRVLTEIPLDDARNDVGAPMLAVRRSELQRTMLERLDNECVRLGSTVIGFKEEKDEVAVQLSTGDDCRGAALIGCDGLNSTIRRELLDDGEPRYAGYTSWRGICARGGLAVPNELREVWGRGWRFGYVPVNDEELYWFAVANRPMGETDLDGDPRPTLMRAYADWQAAATRIIEATRPERILRTDIRDRPPVRRWSRGSVTLVGDAAHPMTPDLGQGASQAIEDAVVLADRLTRASSIVQGFREYELARFARTARLTKLSRRFGRMAQLDSALGCRVRNMLVLATPGRVSRRQARTMWRFQP